MADIKTDALCPKCGGRITIGSALLATPYRLTCPHCRSKLKMAVPGLWLWLMGAVTLGVLLAAGLLYVLMLENPVYLGLYLAAGLVLIVAAEILATVVFFSRGEIKPKEK